MGLVGAIRRLIPVPILFTLSRYSAPLLRLCAPTTPAHTWGKSPIKLNIGLVNVVGRFFRPKNA